MRKRLIILLVIIAVIGGLAVWFFNVPQRVGLVKSPTEKLLSATPDREASTALLADLRAAGVNTQGMELYVFPLNDSEGSVAAVVLDASAGFDFRSLGSETGVTQHLTPLAKLGQNEEYDIKRVAVAYKDTGGKTLLTLTAPTEIIVKLADGSISLEQFLEDLEGEVNFAEVVKQAREGLE